MLLSMSRTQQAPGVFASLIIFITGGCYDHVCGEDNQDADVKDIVLGLSFCMSCYQIYSYNSLLFRLGWTEIQPTSESCL